MILQELYNLALRENLVPDPDFEMKPIAWLVEIGETGTMNGIRGNRYDVPQEGKKKPKKLIKNFSVPRDGGRTSGDRAFFFYDKAEYVFGSNIPGEKNPRDAEKLAVRRDLFRARVRDCATATGDEAANQLLIFLNNLAEGRETVDLSVLSGKVAPNDLFAFVYEVDGEFLMTEREAIKAYWKRMRTPEETETAEQGSSATAQCLVTGREFSGIGLFPSIKKVPGGTTSGVGLVSFNTSASPAFGSYGWSFNENAPICREAAEAAATALNRLLDTNPVNPAVPSENLPRQNIRLSENTAVCYWSRAESDFCENLHSLMSGDADNVKELYQSLWKGKKPLQDDYSPFYALTLSGTQGRAILRDWFISTINKVQGNLEDYFKDIAICRNNRSKESALIPFSLAFLLESIADPTKQRSEGVPGHIAGEMIGAAFAGRLYPATILPRAIERYRCELGRRNDDKEGWITRERNDARVALIKAVLNRKNSKNSVNGIQLAEVKVDMNPNENNKGYRLGRLMAVLEKFQVEALQSEKENEDISGTTQKNEPTHDESANEKSSPQGINSTLVDRFFKGASATPKAVFPRLLVNVHHYAKKLSDKKQDGKMIAYSRYIDEILAPFGYVPSYFAKENNLHKYPESFPQFLSLDDQGLFIIGYHHMRRWLWMNREERMEWEAVQPDCPKIYKLPEKNSTESPDGTLPEAP